MIDDAVAVLPGVFVVCVAWAAVFVLTRRGESRDWRRLALRTCVAAVVTLLLVLLPISLAWAGRPRLGDGVLLVVLAAICSIAIAAVVAAFSHVRSRLRVHPPAGP